MILSLTTISIRYHKDVKEADGGLQRHVETLEKDVGNRLSMEVSRARLGLYIDKFERVYIGSSRKEKKYTSFKSLLSN